VTVVRIKDVHVVNTRPETRWRNNAVGDGHFFSTPCRGRSVTEGEIEEMGRGGRRPQQLLDDIKETPTCWKFKEKALDRYLRNAHTWNSKCMKF